MNVLTPEAILTTPQVKFLDTRLCALDTCVAKCTPEDVRKLKVAASRWLQETLQTGEAARSSRATYV